MKKLFLALTLALAMQAPVLARADAPVNVLLAGSDASNAISIKLTPDGRSYVIDSVVPLEVGGSVCVNPPGMPTELICQAPAVASFEMNAIGGDDTVLVSGKVLIPVTVRSGPGNDYIVGGGGSDKLVGGEGNDRLVGRRGEDLLLGGGGSDILIGGSDDDMLRGGLGSDRLLAGPGANKTRQ